MIASISDPIPTFAVIIQRMWLKISCNKHIIGQITHESKHDPLQENFIFFPGNVFRVFNTGENAVEIRGDKRNIKRSKLNYRNFITVLDAPFFKSKIK